MIKSYLSIGILMFSITAVAQNTFPNSGKVGIGTTTPSYNLEVQGGSTLFRLVSSNSNPATPAIDMYDHVHGTEFVLSPSAGKVDMFTYSNHALAFGTGASEKMRIAANGNVGIGTDNPTHALTINGDIKLNGQSKGVAVEYATFSESVGGASTILGNNIKAGAGNNTVRRFFNPYDPGSYLSLNYYNGITFHTGINSALNTDISSLENEVMRITQTGNVGIGTTDPKGYKLAVAGNMIAESVKVSLQANWPDYVFASDYQLPSLQETEKHIKDKGHLPGIPSAVEVKANGIDLGEMNAKLLQKIEELTLHLIEKDKLVGDLLKRVEKLEDRK